MLSRLIPANDLEQVGLGHGAGVERPCGACVHEATTVNREVPGEVVSPGNREKTRVHLAIACPGDLGQLLSVSWMRNPVTALNEGSRTDEKRLSLAGFS